jgi:ABC-type branched-subunit amino acid transport system substrate-binding protein
VRDHDAVVGSSPEGASKRRKAVRRLGCSLFAVGLLAAGCASSGATSSSSDGTAIRIGISTDSPTLNGFTDGFVTYIDYVNAHGGVKGQHISLVEQNDQADPAKLSTGIDLFASENVDFILANTLASAFGNLYRTAATDQIPVDVPDTPTSTIYPYIYTQQPATADEMVTELNAAETYHLFQGAPRVATMTIGDPSLDPVIASAVAARVKQLGGTVVAHATFGFTDTSFTAGAQEIAQAHPNILLTSIGLNDPIWDHALRAAGVTVPIMGYSNDYQLPNLQQVNDPNFYPFSFLVDPEIPDPQLASLQAMISQAKTAGTTQGLAMGPDFTANYMVAELLVAALNECAPNCDAQKVNDALDSMSNFDSDGLSLATVGYSPTSRSFGQGAQFAHYVDGKVVNLGSPVPIARG